MDSRHQASIGFGNKARAPAHPCALPRRCCSAARVTATSAYARAPPRPLAHANTPQTPARRRPQVRAASMGRHGGPKIDTSILREAEHADLIHYGLIPEFVGRLPIISVLQARGAAGGCAAVLLPALTRGARAPPKSAYGLLACLSNCRSPLPTPHRS